MQAGQQVGPGAHYAENSEGRRGTRPAGAATGPAPQRSKCRPAPAISSPLSSPAAALPSLGAGGALHSAVRTGLAVCKPRSLPGLRAARSREPREPASPRDAHSSRPSPSRLRRRLSGSGAASLGTPRFAGGRRSVAAALSSVTRPACPLGHPSPAGSRRRGTRARVRPAPAPGARAGGPGGLEAGGVGCARRRGACWEV